MFEGKLCKIYVFEEIVWEINEEFLKYAFETDNIRCIKTCY